MKELLSRTLFFIKLQKITSVILAVCVLLIVATQVLLRYVFKAPLMGIEEALIFPTIWLYMFGGANASQERNHIECGILTLYIKKPLSIIKFNVIRSTLSVIVGGWLLYWAYWLLTYSLKALKTSDLLYIPMIIMESAPFIGLLLMLLYAVYDLRNIVQLYLIERRK